MPDPTPDGAGEFEWVDAEAPDTDTSALPDMPLENCVDAATAASRRMEPLHTLRSRARRRLQQRLTQRRKPAPASREPWESWPLDAVQYCVIDLETTRAATGGDDEILEIGAVQVSGRELGREFATLVDPRRPIAAAANRVHGIDARAVRSAPRIDETLPWLLEMVGDRVLVFHNAGFDLGFLQRALIESGREPFAQPVLDTLVLARRTFGGRCSLSALAQRLGLQADRPHRALSDARTTARLLVELVAVCADSGVQALGDVPAVSPARAGHRARRRARVDPLLERLETALRRRESLRITYHAGAGVAPLELVIRPLRLRGGIELLAHDELVARHVMLDVARIRSVRVAP